MFTQSFRRAAAAAIAALFLTATFVAAQSDGPPLKISRTLIEEKERARRTPVVEMGKAEAFRRLHPESAPALQSRDTGRPASREGRQRAFSTTRASAAAPSILSFATGDGDINESEPNDNVAQAVSLPVNIFGTVRVDGDDDFFAFQGLAGQQITIEPFAARITGSRLIADIALFDANGNLLVEDVGDELTDPLIRFTPTQDQVLIVGITDADDFGGSRFTYLLNLTRGFDTDEAEPNDRTAQALSTIPSTIFGNISVRDDVDFYSFVATAGQTLIVDLDAEVLGSRLDAEMNLSDPQSGVELFFNDQKDGDDPRFNIVLPYTGRYVLGVGSFNSNSTGFYRLNASIVSGSGAPVVTSVTKLSKKLFEIAGAGFGTGSVVEVNGDRRKTTFVSSGILRAKVKARAGDVVTVSNAPDDRRSNPLLVQ